MPRPQMKALLLAALAGMAISACSERAFGEPLPGTDTPEQAAPQGEGPAGASDEEVTPLPPSKHKGVIQPPEIGDEDIYTDVPDPDAGHPEEVIPPSELPEQTPDTPAR